MSASSVMKQQINRPHLATKLLASQLSSLESLKLENCV